MKKINFMLSQPEGQFIELKRAISKNINREIVAFANSGGGHIMVGVNNDGKVVGVLNVNSQISRLESIARNCDPLVPIKVMPYQKDGKDIFVVEVIDGDDKPYTCSSGFYLRQESNSQKRFTTNVI